MLVEFLLIIFLILLTNKKKETSPKISLKFLAHLLLEILFRVMRNVHGNILNILGNVGVAQQMPDRCL